MGNFKVHAEIDLYITAKDKKQAEDWAGNDLDLLFDNLPAQTIGKFKFTAEEVEEPTPVANLNAV
jgi:hypothetical protein